MTKFYNNFYFYIELGEIFQEMVQEWYQIVVSAPGRGRARNLGREGPLNAARSDLRRYALYMYNTVFVPE